MLIPAKFIHTILRGGCVISSLRYFAPLIDYYFHRAKKEAFTRAGNQRATLVFSRGIDVQGRSRAYSMHEDARRELSIGIRQYFKAASREVRRAAVRPAGTEDLEPTGRARDRSRWSISRVTAIRYRLVMLLIFLPFHLHTTLRSESHTFV